MKKKRPRSLRWIVVLAVGLILSIFIIVFFTIVQTTMSKMLLQSESEHLLRQMEAVRDTLSVNMDDMRGTAKDVAHWEETVQYATGNNPDYLERNWPGTTVLERYQFNILFILDAEGNLLHEDYKGILSYDDLSDAKAFAGSLGELCHGVLAAYDALRPASVNDPGIGRTGILFWGGAPYAVSVMPIVVVDGVNEPVGTVLFGNIMTDPYLKKLTHFATTDFALLDAGTPVGETTVMDVNPIDDGVISVALPLTDIDGNEIMLRMSMQRTLYAGGQAIIALANVLLVAVAVLFMATMYFVIAKYVLRPIERLSRSISALSSTDTVDAEQYAGSRELYALCAAVNEMRARVNDSMRLMEETSVSMHGIESILNGIDAFLYVSDAENDDILYINDKMKEHYGLPGDIIGQTCWKALQSGMTERCAFCPMRRLVKEPDATITWEEHSTVTGRYYRNTDCLIQWTGGKMAHLQHSVDITEIKAAQAALNARLEQQELMSAMSQSFIASDAVADLIRGALRMAGEFLNVSRIALSHLDGAALRPAYEWHNEKQANGGGETPAHPYVPGDALYEAFAVRKLACLSLDDVREGGHPLGRAGVRSFLAVPVHVSGAFWGVLSLDESAEPRAWSASDIQLVRMIANVISGAISRDATKEDLVRMSSIVDSSPYFVSYMNEGLSFEYLNQGALDLTGYSAGELRQRGAAGLFSERTLRRVMDEAAPHLAAEGRWTFEGTITRKDGERRTISVSIFRTGLRENGYGVIATDITERRRLEKDLIAAKEQAEEASQAKGEFLSRMSHEMRTPMNAIIGMTSIAKASADLARKEHCLDKIDDASKHLLGIINDVLDMSKIEANKFELSSGEFSFEKMLLRVINVINFRVEEKKQKLLVDLDEKMPQHFLSDDQRLAQVIANLLSNAVKFTPEGGIIALAARVIERQGDDCLVRVSVSDTGIGISEEQQQRLFRSFEQADGGISRKFGGTGLGLAISKKIVEMMGGRIWVESEPGKGSTFLFEVRMRICASAGHAALSPDVDWQSLRVLAVDHEPEALESFVNMMGALGLSCDAANGGGSALAMVQKGGCPYDIIFTARELPEMDGLALARRVKAHCDKTLVVLMGSALEWDRIEPEARAVGVDRFVAKPLFSSQLVDCVNACLGKEQAQAAPAQAAPPDYRGKTLLLAEDVEINREIVLALLEDTGVAIDSAENGTQAVRMFEKNPGAYDLIFMDIHMPEMDGLTATRLIRALEVPCAKTVPIVAMTANVFREDIEKCLEAGMNGHIGKPIDRDDLMQAMKAYLG